MPIKITQILYMACEKIGNLDIELDITFELS